MDPIPLGEVSIHTDPEIGIYLRQEEGDAIFLGHTDFSGKLPAGENIIELRNLDGFFCRYSMFLNDKEVHKPVHMPFERKFMVRTNVTGGDIQLSNQFVPAYRIKANKKIKTKPMLYAITINKKGYQPYRDTVDLTKAGVEQMVYRANLRKLNDTTQVKSSGYKSPAFLQRFYDNAGTWFIGILDFGYSFDFNGGNGYRHQVHLGVLPIRYRMLGINPGDFEMTVNDGNLIKTICYRPKLSVVLPCTEGFGFTFYGGVSVNLSDWSKHEDQIRTHMIGGASMHFNYAHRFPMDIFAEYKWPVQGVDKSSIGHKEQLFRVGIIFTGGIDF